MAQPEIGRPTLKPRKVPGFQRRLFNTEVGGRVLPLTTRLVWANHFLYFEWKVRIWHATVGLAAVDGGMYFEPDIKVLSSKEVGSVLSLLALFSKR